MELIQYRIWVGVCLIIMDFKNFGGCGIKDLIIGWLDICIYL